MKKEFEIYQDNKGNVYTITTELEELLLKDIVELSSIIKEVREELNKIDSATYQGDTDKKTYYKYEQPRIQKLLEILDKGE